VTSVFHFPIRNDVEFSAMFAVEEYRKNWKWNWKEHVLLLRQLWNENNPHTYIGKSLITLLLIGPMISPSNWFIAKEEKGEAELKATRRMDWYIFLWALTLTLILRSQTPSDPPGLLPRTWLRFVIGLPVGFRIFDSVSYRLYFLFCKSSWKPWKDARRSLAIALANLYEVVVAYGILYLLSGEICDGQQKLLTGRLDAVYYSFVTITTLGYGDFWPAGRFARFLVMSELATGITFLVVIIPSLVSLISESGGSAIEPHPAADVEDVIRKRAFAIYESGGRQTGHDREDWLQAEDEILKLKKTWLYKPILAVLLELWGTTLAWIRRGTRN
jgi:hypothetical protein